MALVAYDSDISDSDEENDQEATPAVLVKNNLPAKVNGTASKTDEISDDEETYPNASNGLTENVPSILDEDEDIIGLSSSKSLFASLPTTAQPPNNTEHKIGDFVDEQEDLSTIPKAKEYEKTAEKPPPSKKRKGPVRIAAPSLKDFDDDDDEDSVKRKLPTTGEKKKGSGLFALLPAPVHAKKQVPMVPRTVTRKPLPPKQPMVPRSVAQKKKAAPKADDDSDDDETPTSFFTLNPEPIETTPAADLPSPALPTVIANPDAPVPSRYGHPSEQYRVLEEPLGPAVAPYPPPEPGTSSGYADADDLLANEAALEKLAGKHSLRNKEQMNIIDVSGDDIAPDPKEWMLKSLSKDEEKAAEAYRCTVGGVTKRKHQITYLAALAKENEHKLKEQWAANAANRRAASQKYGFR